MGLCTPGICVPVAFPASWNNRASTAIPDTSGRGALSHKSRGTVHGGNDLDTFSKSRVADPLCLSLKCSWHSLTEPFQTAHHSTGQRQSWPRSRWQHIICDSNDDSVIVLHTGQLGMTVYPFWTPISLPSQTLHLRTPLLHNFRPAMTSDGETFRDPPRR